MTDEKKRDKKWKQSLLKSSLPLELLAAKKLGCHGFDVLGEYPFMRANEAGVPTDCSVDILAEMLINTPRGDPCLEPRNSEPCAHRAVVVAS
jgi:hypothetical protein